MASPYSSTSGPPTSQVRDSGTRRVGGLGQVVQHVVDGDRLNLVVHPLRGRHRRQPVGEVPDHLERRRTRADRRCPPAARRSRCPTRSGSRRRRRATAGAGTVRPSGCRPRQVDDAAHAGRLRRGGDVARRLRLLGDEVRRRAHRVHQVVDDVDAVERRRSASRDRSRSPRTTSTSVAPRCVGELVGVARQRPHGRSRASSSSGASGRRCSRSRPSPGSGFHSVRHSASIRRNRFKVFGADDRRRMSARASTQTGSRDSARPPTAGHPPDRCRQPTSPTGSGPRLRPMCTWSGPLSSVIGAPAG